MKYPGQMDGGGRNRDTERGGGSRRSGAKAETGHRLVQCSTHWPRLPSPRALSIRPECRTQPRDHHRGQAPGTCAAGWGPALPEPDPAPPGTNHLTATDLNGSSWSPEWGGRSLLWGTSQHRPSPLKFPQPFEEDNPGVPLSVQGPPWLRSTAGTATFSQSAGEQGRFSWDAAAGVRDPRGLRGG